MPFDAATYQPPQPARRDTPASLLIAEGMRRIATPRKWGKGMAGLCIARALSSAAIKNSHMYVVTVPLLHAAASRRGFERVWDFNDHPSTTHADVLACMEEARLAAMEPVYESVTGA